MTDVNDDEDDDDDQDYATEDAKQNDDQLVWLDGLLLGNSFRLGIGSCKKMWQFFFNWMLNDLLNSYPAICNIPYVDSD